MRALWRPLRQWQRLVVVAALAVATASCASWAAVTGAPYVDKKSGFQISAPRGWYQVPAGESSFDVTFTLDGTPLQSLSVEHRAHDEAFPAIDASSTPGMLAEELAEQFIANLKSGLGTEARIIENRPFRLGNQNAVAIHSEFRTYSGLRYRLYHVAAVTPAGLYFVEYRAPTLHFFAAHRDAVDAAIASLVYLPR